MVKTAFVCNGSEPTSVYPTFVLASSAVASGDEVIIFFTPAGAPVLKKGVLEGMTGKGMPDMADLLEGVMALGGRMLLCELAFEAKDLKKEEIREDVEVVGATTFISEIHDAQITFSF
jgi:predicted peroxiredoxin